MREIVRRPPVLETIATEAASFKAFQYARPYFPFVLHYHPEVELTYIVAGSGLRFVGNSIEPYGPGDLVLIGSGVPHTWQSPEPTHRASADRVESIVVQFRTDLWGDARNSLPEFRPLHAMLNRAAAGLQVTDVGLANAVKEILELLVNAHRLSLTRHHLLLSALDVLSQANEQKRGKGLVALSSPQPSASGDVRDTRLNKVLESVQRSLAAGDTFTQSQAAELVRMSPASFSRFFRQKVGRTFVRYVNEWRVGLACRALAQSDESITEIAFSCGFGNLSNFNRRFKQIKKLTPRQFRSMAGK
jgi:AraC-like DNA-binding protein